METLTTTQETIYQAAEIAINYKVKPAPSEAYKITDADKIYNLMINVAELSGNLQYKEMFYSILLNNASEVIAIHKIGEGATNATLVDIKFIMQGAILTNATTIIVCHNHPSGNTKPSAADIELTSQIKHAAKIFGIRLLDSIIISKENYFSFLENCLID